MTRRFVVLLVLLSAIAASAPRGSAQAPGSPRLIVLVVVDQLRQDYLSRHRQALTGGLGRLLDRGAVFSEAAYPYLNTVTCAGHSTIGTGTLPYRHGMILNAWYDRAAGASTSCTADAAERTFGVNGTTAAGHSARRLLAGTLADRVRASFGQVVSISQKARSAIGMAGHGGDVVLWFDERGDWVTSSAFAPAPPPFVREFVAGHPMAADYGKVWERTLPLPEYTGVDDAAGEKPPAGWTTTFPHALAAPSGKPDPAFYSLWARSPFADEYLGRMAAAAVDAFRLGRGAQTDLLAVSFSALDLAGHAFGPESHEVQDLVLRLDRTLGLLLDHLDRSVGRDGYVLALSADHGVSGIPEQTPGAGRHSAADVRAAIDAALTPIFGPPPAPRGTGVTASPAKPSYMAYNAYTDTYLADGIMDRLRKDRRALEAVLNALRALPGIAHAFSGDELTRPGARDHRDPVKRAAALSYHPGRSGDLIIAPKPNWILSSSAATHGTLHDYDSRVPVIFYGRGVARGTFSAAATPADIAPTLAALAGVAFTAADGRILSPAVAAPAISK